MLLQTGTDAVKNWGGGLKKYKLLLGIFKDEFILNFK